MIGIPAFSQSGRLLSTESNKVDEPFKVQEAETVNVPPPPSEKLLVLGGNGFVGSHVCKEALEHGLSVASLSRFHEEDYICRTFTMLYDKLLQEREDSGRLIIHWNVLLELRFTLNAVGNQLGDWNQYQVNPCIWNSISCDNNQNVVTLTLAYMGFTGKLSSSLGELKHLKVLNSIAFT
ncbi:uncharacterized protein A4U43_C03F28970 [Asparagus officinalis]|uniref:NAD-dependent epimerase/dehydratase domain-containing protein n=1 Tax=Asparagus officinalis TaxID=4686 RepID=A0A5P1FDP9_ASPOF|nr:uncharacterized protein A4U43_C03F28970 [Asparagus officinalis]